MVPNRFAYVGIVSKITGHFSFSLWARMTFTPYTRKGSRSERSGRRAPPSEGGCSSGALRTQGAALGRRLFVFALALLERIQVIENVMANFLEVFGNLLAG